MRAEREKLNAKITAGALKLAGGRLELPAEMCHIVLFSGGSCTVQCGDTSLLVSPGCALLLGPGRGRYRHNFVRQSMARSVRALRFAAPLRYTPSTSG